jgi:hypothetical protein
MVVTDRVGVAAQCYLPKGMRSLAELYDVGSSSIHALTP